MQMTGDNPVPPGKHLQVLDGWRGISILAVLACHLLPLGPKRLEINWAAGLLGMSLFFCLSGFLITRFLLERGNVADFLIRRLCRILPLAWLALIPGLLLAHASGSQYAPNFLFYANLRPSWLTDITGHYWSLCVEVQFYAAIALLFLAGHNHALKLIPLASITITLLRIHNSQYVSIETYYRVDEILSGATLALLYSGEFGETARRLLMYINPWIAAILLLLSTHPFFQAMNYGRPYFAAALVAASLCRLDFPARRLLVSKPLAYIAEISYALYIVHPILDSTWLGSGDKTLKYAKRPLLFIAIFAIAHLSTYKYESRWIALGKRFGKKLSKS